MRWLVRIVLVWSSIVGLVACSQVTRGLYNGYQGTGGEARHYALAQQYFRQGDYQRSLEESLTLISQYPKGSLYDKALFYAALNNLHLGNPEVNYSKASDYFKRLSEECPKSPILAESNAWIAILTSLSMKDKELTTLKKELEEKKSQETFIKEEKTETMQQLREEMELRIQQLQEKKNREIAQLKKERERLKQELELLKKVDVQLEQRKKGLKTDDKRKNPGRR